MPVNSGAAPKSRRPSSRASRPVMLAELALGSGAALDPLLQRFRVAGNGCLEVAVHAQRDRERGDGDDDAEHTADCGPVRANRPHAGCPAAAGRDEEHRKRRARRVGERQDDDVEAEIAACRDDRDRREHGPRARHEHEPERGAEQEPAAEVAAGPPAEPRQPLLEHEPDAREEQRCGDDEEEDDREVSQEVLREAERVEEPDAGEREGREARDQAGDDRVRPAPAPRCSAGEQDRQHREHTRRESRDQPGRKADRDQDEHAVLEASPGLRVRAGARLASHRVRAPARTRRSCPASAAPAAACA